MTAAADLRVGDVLSPGWLPPHLTTATILFAHPYTAPMDGGVPYVFVAYVTEDGWVESTSFLAAAEIPLTSRTPAKPAPECPHCGRTSHGFVCSALL